jgi:hypothetical protein
MTVPVRDQGLLELKLTEPSKAQRKKRRRSWFFTGRRDEPEPSHLGVLEDPDPKAIGICCSGGGIRSAAFNLGALQALQQREILKEARYLAAVSGGSYIAAAFCMVAKRGPRDSDDSDPKAFDETTPPFHPGSPEEQYLRNRSSYLAPDGLSKLFLAYRVLLGLVFNLLFLGCALFAIGIVLAWAVYRPLYGSLADPEGACTERVANDCTFAADVPNGFLWLLIALGASILVNGLALLLLRPKKDRWRRGLETWATRLMLATAALAVVVVLIPVLAELLLNIGTDDSSNAPTETASAPGLPAVGAASFTTVLIAILLQLRSGAAEPATVLQAVTGARGFFMRLGSRSRLAFAYVAGAVAGPLLLLAIVVFSASWALANSDSTSTNGWVLGAGAVALAAFAGLYFVADLNTWSLHPFYRRRLCTAFALRRVLENGVRKAEERKYEKLVPLSETGVEGEWPTLIVCAAANVSDPGATPPGRGVTSFTFSDQAIGGPLVGAENTKTYEDALGKNRRRDITLPAAVAMSGAALSPSMGKQTHRPLTFLMALANVRLGVWIPNPRYVEKWEQAKLVKQRDDPHDVFKMPRPKYLFLELLGRNRLDAKFLYVSDGGHYENLGLVELLRRGCTRIYCFDASGGETFTALGDAIALARSELGVEIDIKPDDLVPEGERHLAKSDCVHARFRYADGTKGVLIYARTVMTADVPFDVTAYHDADPKFPHHSTADQLYTDQKFEAYRALGGCAGHHAAETMDDTPLDPETEVSTNGGDKPLVSFPLGGDYRLDISHHRPLAEERS